ncbi:MAG: hypothetical protein ACJ73L_12440 [Actinomycetes bacterium]
MNAYAALKITDAHGCPHCGMPSGDYCVTTTGLRAQTPHVLRTNAAKRAATRVLSRGSGESVPCPAECGDRLTLALSGWVRHQTTNVFECGATS